MPTRRSCAAGGFQCHDLAIRANPARGWIVGGFVCDSFWLAHTIATGCLVDLFGACGSHIEITEALDTVFNRCAVRGHHGHHIAGSPSPVSHRRPASQDTLIINKSLPAT